MPEDQTDLVFYLFSLENPKRKSRNSFAKYMISFSYRKDNCFTPKYRHFDKVKISQTRAANYQVMGNKVYSSYK